MQRSYGNGEEDDPLQVSPNLKHKHHIMFETLETTKPKHKHNVKIHLVFALLFWYNDKLHTLSNNITSTEQLFYKKELDKVLIQLSDILPKTNKIYDKMRPPKQGGKDHFKLFWHQFTSSDWSFFHRRNLRNIWLDGGDHSNCGAIPHICQPGQSQLSERNFLRIYCVSGSAVFGILVFGIWYLVFWYLVFGIWHLVFGILVFGI